MPRSFVHHFLGNRCYEGSSSSWRICDITFFSFRKAPLEGSVCLSTAQLIPSRCCPLCPLYSAPDFLGAMKTGLEAVAAFAFPSA
jgi:hypothetical protein